jgi:DNA invertase Pin-like site-specific DNA recombinase
MNAIAYLRVSSEEQADSGNGINGQSDACQTWAARNDCEVAGEFKDEGISGAAGINKRPGLLDAVAALKRGDVLVVAKRDRIGRDPIVVAMAEAAVSRKGARVVSAAGEGTDSDSPTDILMRRMVDAFAEYERLLGGARTKAALHAKIKRGERVGAVRFGHDIAADGQTLTQNKSEQKTLLLITNLRKSGLSLRKIACELTTREIRTKTGNATWTHAAVNRIVKRTVPA